MKKILVIGIISIFILVSLVSAISDNKEEFYKKYFYDTCDEWDNWEFCETGHFHEYRITDNQGKGHLIFKNVGQWRVFYDGKLLWKGVDHDTVTAHTKTEYDPYYMYGSWTNYIWKDLDYEINETAFCTNYRFFKVTNNETIFTKDITNCYSVN